MVTIVFLLSRRRCDMTFYAIGEPEYKTSNWYRHILDGLINEKRQKRFTLTLLENIDELNSHTLTDEDVIFVIGTNSEWLIKIIKVCELFFDTRVIVLGNHESNLSNGRYSVVTTDVARDIHVLYNYLKSHNKTRIAMYGINPDSASDTFRKNSFLSCGTSEEDLFYNNGSLSQCFENFLARIDDYDAVICANDYAAISLIRYLKGEKHIFITSCGGGILLSHFFSPRITHTLIDFQDFGKAGFELSRILQKNKHVNSIKIYLTSTFQVGETTDNLPLTKECTSYAVDIQKDTDAFYSDTEIDEMLRIELLLNSCDKVDLFILEHLLKGATYPKIAEELFMSINGVKYKLKNMFKICQVSTKTEFVALLSKYINNY